MKKNFLLSAFLSTVLLSTSLFSQNIACTGSHCKVDLKKLFPSKNIPVKVIHFTKAPPIEAIPIDTNFIENSNVDSEYIALDSSKYVMQEHEALEHEGVIVLAHAKYIASADEDLEYEEEDSILSEPIERVEHKILNQSLPMSNHYCENEKKAIYHKESNSYECA